MRSFLFVITGSFLLLSTVPSAIAQGSYESTMKQLAEGVHSSLTGTENKTVLVSIFRRMEGKGCYLDETITGDFEVEFGKLPKNFKVLNRAVLDEYAKEHKLQMEGQMDEEQKMKEAGRLLKADIMIFGSYRFIGKNLVLRVHADDIQTSEQLAILSLTCVPTKELKLACEEAGTGPAISRDRPSSGAPGTRSEPGGGSNSSPNTTTPAVPCGSQVGDYCFENRSAKEMTVRLHGNRMMATTIMVSPGGSECFLGIAAGVYTYQVEYRDSRPPYRYNGPGGNIRIEPCKSGTYTYR